jgi:hypothetical protein
MTHKPKDPKHSAPIRLPDGSAFFTADIMSKAEAMKLPPPERPLCFRISSNLYHAVWEAIGEASLCWQPKPSTHFFDTSRASQIATDLCFKIAEELESLQQRIEKLEHTP